LTTRFGAAEIREGGGVMSSTGRDTKGENGGPSSDSDLPFSPGSLVAGRYQIVRLIGSGGAGDVFEARDTVLGVSVALKTLKPWLAESAIQIARFRREIQNARKVTHRNVCRIFDMGVEPSDGQQCFFLTMELLPGRTLADRLDAGQVFTPAEALTVALQIAEGLQAAHDAGIVHRDLKPGNIIVLDRRAVITDFGIALSTAPDDIRLTESGEVVGTPQYMAPEQLDPGPAQPTTDIYAFGLILYEMLTARGPFEEGKTPLESVLVRRMAPPRPIRELLPAIDPTWEAAIMRCIEREPLQRFARASDVAAALRAGSTPPATDGGGVLGRIRRAFSKKTKS
jgi:serine/threonine protein kinase